jgi:hypothetical protein
MISGDDGIGQGVIFKRNTESTALGLSDKLGHLDCDGY